MFSLSLPLLATLTVAWARSPYDVSKSEWDTLNLTVNGRLAFGVPLARNCFQQVGPNMTNGEVDCAIVQSNYSVDLFRISQFGSMIRTQWETCQKTNEGCLLDSTHPNNSTGYSPPKVCRQGSVAPYYISVKTPHDASQAFLFSKRTGVPLSIKNTGGGARDLERWLSGRTQNLKGIKYIPNFVPDKCSGDGVPSITYGAGEYLQSIYEFSDKNRITFIGGAARSIGAAGWTMGGGHSILTNTYGLGIDRVQQFRIVTPDGKYRTANKCHNKDLFWALRGGGGGTFGVVMEITSQVVPNPVPTVSLLWTLESTPENLSDLMRIVTKNSVRWVEEGWGGYVFATSSIMANPKLNTTAATASLKPLTDFLQASGAQIQWNNFTSYSSLFEAIRTLKFSVGLNGAMTSRLIPKSLFASAASQEKLYAATMQAFTAAAGEVGLFLTTPYNYASKPGSTSATPAWRNAIWHAVVTHEWGWDVTTAEAREGYSTASAAVRAFHAITPESGSYLNEADVYEPDASTSFWGKSNYVRLLQVKQKYDPSSLLDCWNCVGSKRKNAACYL
ncbi:FAD-binding domain protein [Ceratobasidium sp. AG-Ba]|nr:FAD-binding domain protein [Ceratobasidium sp. AG-Ba]